MITSPANPRLKLVRRLRSASQRRRLGLFVAEGEDLVAAGLLAGLEPVDRLVAGEEVEPALLADLSELSHPPRVVAGFRAPALPHPDPSNRLLLGLALWRVGDPGNVGTLLRCADAFGASVWLSPGCTDPTGAKALRASAGAVFRVPVGRFEDAPRPRIAMVARGGLPLPELELAERATFVLGAEREGLPDAVVEGCDEAATISVDAGAESLNVDAAGAIALYEWSRQRGS